MIASNRVAIPRTSVDYWPDATRTRDVDPQTNVQLSIWLNPVRDRMLDAPRALSMGAVAPTTRSYEPIVLLRERTSSPAADIERVRIYCAKHGLELIDAGWRSLNVRGPLGACMEAFGADLALFTDEEGRSFRSRRGPLAVESEIAPLIQGVFGFSQWPRAQRLGPLQRHVTPLSLADLERRYALPNATGRGTTIGIIQLGGDVRTDDFSRCMSAQGLTREAPLVKRIDDAPGAHVATTSQDLESALDAQIAGAIAQGARIVIYRASNSERGLLAAVRTALFDEEHQPSILSISYGWPERLWTPAAIDILNDLFTAAALLGVTICCASGDNGAELDAAGKPHVLFPASSPYVLACGATVIDENGDSESAWDRSGGGQSEIFNGRGVPDVAAQQHPGYFVYLDGVELAAGGTSAVAPMWAALIARVNERMGTRAGFFRPLLYNAFSASTRWNSSTGLGVLSGASVEAALRA